MHVTDDCTTQPRVSPRDAAELERFVRSINRIWCAKRTVLRA